MVVEARQRAGAALSSGKVPSSSPSSDTTTSVSLASAAVVNDHDDTSNVTWSPGSYVAGAPSRERDPDRALAVVDRQRSVAVVGLANSAM